MDFKIVCKLLGDLGLTFSAIMLIPFFAAYFYDPGSLNVFSSTLCTALFISIILLSYGSRKRNKRLRLREAITVVGCGWLMVCLLGALPYIFSGELDAVSAIFESVSGFTTTGVTTAGSLNDFSVSVLVWRSLTHWCGGIGVIMLFIIIMPQMNSGTSYLFNAELPGAVAERTMPRIRESAMVIVGIYIMLTLLEISLLLLAGLPLYQAVNLALATMATGGFSYFHDSLISFDSIAIEMIAIIFMLISSMNFSLYYKIFRGDWTAFRNDTEHRYYLAFLTFAAVCIIIDLTVTGYMSFPDSVRHGIFQTVSIGSTTGFASDDFNNWPGFSRYMLFLLMFVGGCSGSTAGGIKISRIVILLKACWAELLRTLHPRLVYSIKMGNRVIDPEIVGNITRFFFLYIIVFMVLTILISLTGLSIMDSMGLIAACMSSVGPAFGIVGPTATYADISTFGRVISIFAMLLGRLEIFTLLILLRPDFWHNKQNW